MDKGGGVVETGRNFADKGEEVNFLWFSSDIFYEWPLRLFQNDYITTTSFKKKYLFLKYLKHFQFQIVF